MTFAEFRFRKHGAEAFAAKDKGFGCVVVVSGEGQLAGIVTDGDLRRLMSGRENGKIVDDVMSTAPRTVLPNVLAATALETLNSASITVLIVVEDDRPVGIVHLHDLLRLGVA